MASSGHAPFDPYMQKVQDLADAVSKNHARIDQASNAFAERSCQFFERLAILNGSALALSVSLLGYLFTSSKKTDVTSHWALDVSWVLFLVAMASALGRNYCFQRHQWYELFKHFATSKRDHHTAKAEALQNSPVPVFDRYTGFPLDRGNEVAVEQHNAEINGTAIKKAERNYSLHRRLRKFFEFSSLMASVLAATLLVLFTIKNT